MCFGPTHAMHAWIQGNSMWKNKVPCAHFAGFPHSSALPEMVKIYSNLMKGAGQRSFGSLRSLEENRGLSQWLFSTVCLWPLLSRCTGPERSRLTQLSPEPWDGGGPHACGGLPPSGTNCDCGKPEQGNRESSSEP